MSCAMPEAGQATLAYETHGEGVAVVFLHGLTFDRRTWRPIIERLGVGVRCIAVDLPGHGETGGPGCGLDEAAARTHATLRSIDVDAPIIVGHSMSGTIAMMYAAAHRVRGVVDVDQTMNVRPFAELVQRLGPALRGGGFASVFNTFQASMGLDHLSEPLRSMVLETQRINQDIVLPYWDEVLRSDPLELQKRIEGILQAVDVPCLCVFGQVLPADDREDVQRLRDVQLEEWPDRGHFVHLAEPDRFSARLRAFIARCTETPQHHGPRAPLSRPDVSGGSAESVAHQVAALAQRYSVRADAYDRLWSPAIRPFGERLINALPFSRAERLIDVGTGAGALLPALQRAAPKAAIVGVDNSEGMLRLARSRHAGRLELMNIEALTFGDAWFDVAVAAFVLFHLPHPERCLAGVFRVLKPGGSVGTATWGHERFPQADTIWDETLTQMGAITVPPPATENRACCDSESKVEALLEQAGFSASRLWRERLLHRWDPELHFEHQVLATSRTRLESLDADQRARCLEQLHARLQTASLDDYVYEGDVILATAVKP